MFIIKERRRGRGEAEESREEGEKMEERKKGPRNSSITEAIGLWQHNWSGLCQEIEEREKNKLEL